MNQAGFYFSLKGLSEQGQIEGLAAGYSNVDAHGDTFAPGAFAKSIDAMHKGERQPAMLLHHDPRRPIGKWTDFKEGADGLTVRGTLALASKDGQDAYALLKAGALTGLSVGFRTIEDTGIPGKTGRLIKAAELFEVSLVSTPSNPLTRVSDVKAVASVRDLEELLREAGFSGRRAKAAANAAWAAAHTDPEPTVSASTKSLLEASMERLRSLNF